MQRTWRTKANQLITDMCMASYLEANRLPNGRLRKLRKRHAPYSVPTRAQQLVECLGRDDEQQAKYLFMLFLDCPDAMKD